LPPAGSLIWRKGFTGSGIPHYRHLQQMAQQGQFTS